MRRRSGNCADRYLENRFRKRPCGVASKKRKWGNPPMKSRALRARPRETSSSTPDGALLVVEEAIAAAYLPKAVKQTWNKRFANYTIVLVEKVTRHNEVTYEIQSTNLGKLSENVFDGSGKELTVGPSRQPSQ